MMAGATAEAGADQAERGVEGDQLQPRMKKKGWEGYNDLERGPIDLAERLAADQEARRERRVAHPRPRGHREPAGAENEGDGSGSHSERPRGSYQEATVDALSPIQLIVQLRDLRARSHGITSHLAIINVRENIEI